MVFLFRFFLLKWLKQNAYAARVWLVLRFTLIQRMNAFMFYDLIIIYRIAANQWIKKNLNLFLFVIMCIWPTYRWDECRKPTAVAMMPSPTQLIWSNAMYSSLAVHVVYLWKAIKLFIVMREKKKIKRQQVSNDLFFSCVQQDIAIFCFEFFFRYCSVSF